MVLMTWEIDADLVDADWLRTLRWDLPVDTDAFLSVIRPEMLPDFMRLPAAQAMPDDLRAALIGRGLPVPEAPAGLPVSEAVLMEHPGHSNQRVHGRWAHGTPGGQQSLGLRDEKGRRIGAPAAKSAKGDASSEDLKSAVSSGSSYSLSDSPDEQELLNGKITNIRDSNGGISATFVGEINGKKVWLKPSDGMYPDEIHDGIDPGTDHENEMASLLVNRELGNLIPTPTVVVRTGLPSQQGYTDDVGDFTTDSTTRWLVARDASSLAPKGARNSGYLGDLDDERKADYALFDQITGQCDRHGRNYMVYDDDGRGHGQPLPVALDNGLSFSRGHPDPWNTDWMDEGGGLTLTSRQQAAVDSFVARRAAIEPRLAAVVGTEAAAMAFRRAEYISGNGATMTTDEFKMGDWDPGYSGGGGGNVSFVSTSPHGPGQTSNYSSFNADTTQEP